MPGCWISLPHMPGCQSTAGVKSYVLPAATAITALAADESADRLQYGRCQMTAVTSPAYVMLCYVTEAVMGGSWSNQRKTYQPVPAQSCSNHYRNCTLPLLTILAAEKSSKEHLHRLLPQFHACILCFCSQLAILLPYGNCPAGRSQISMSMIISMQLTFALQSIL